MAMSVSAWLCCVISFHAMLILAAVMGACCVVAGRLMCLAVSLVLERVLWCWWFWVGGVLGSRVRAAFAMSMGLGSQVGGRGVLVLACFPSAWTMGMARRLRAFCVVFDLEGPCASELLMVLCAWNLSWIASIWVCPIV